MTKQVRDWHKDMKRVENFKYVQTLVNGIQPRFHGELSAPPEPVEYALEYWLQQYAAEKGRADKAEYEKRMLIQTMLKGDRIIAELQEDLEAAEAREKKLREAIKEAMDEEWRLAGEPTPVYTILHHSLYPKEEVAKTFTFDAIIHVYDGIKTTVQQQRLTGAGDSEKDAKKKLSLQIQEEYKILPHLGLSGLFLTAVKEEGANE